MHKKNSIYIDGDFAEIFNIAAKVEQWPKLLPHYEKVTILEESQGGKRRIVSMHAVRPDFPLPGNRFPVSWTSVQLLEPEVGRITFKHLSGLACGMWVVWEIKPDAWGRGFHVTIRHDLVYPFVVLNYLFGPKVVSEIFIDCIAGLTLRTIKQIVEARAIDGE